MSDIPCPSHTCPRNTGGEWKGPDKGPWERKWGRELLGFGRVQGLEFGFDLADFFQKLGFGREAEAVFGGWEWIWRSVSRAVQQWFADSSS